MTCALDHWELHQLDFSWQEGVFGELVQQFFIIKSKVFDNCKTVFHYCCLHGSIETNASKSGQNHDTITNVSHDVEVVKDEVT
jgi:hypothetical protein